MEEQSATLVGLSWIPNFSGKVSCTDSLTRCFSDDINDEDYSFDYDSRTRSVIVSCKDDRKIRIKIEFVDDSGLCYIYLINQKCVFNYDSNDYDELETSYTIMESWRRIIQIVGNASSIQSYGSNMPLGAMKNCICNAMDWPIKFDESMIPNRHELILDQFIKRCDDVVDVTRYVSTLASRDIFGNERTESIRQRMNAENNGISIQSINSIYMDSFISLYSDEIENKQRYWRENRLLTRKPMTISNYNSNYVQIDNLSLMSKSINVAKWGVIIASVAFVMNAISLILTNL